MKNLLKILVLCFSSLSLFGQIPLSEDFVVIQNESAINTPNLEYSPAFFEEGIIFISTTVAAPQYKIVDKNIGKNIMSIYKAPRNQEGLLEKPVVFATELLSEFHEGPITFDRTNETLYFTRNNTNKKKSGKRRLKIYSAEKTGSQWGSTKELPFNGDEFDTCHPAISVDNDALYFSSNREGGYGGMDLWVSFKDSGEWLDPINLGPNVNTASNEVFPYVHADGTLYFSSNGLEGKGKLDLYYVLRDEDSWTKPQNLGKPFNSDEDDFGFIIDRDNKNGYFSSNRKTGLGEDDIYNFYLMGDLQIADQKTNKKKGKKTEVALTITDPDTGDKMDGAKVTYYNLDNITLGEAMTDQNGETGILSLIKSDAGGAPTYRLNLDKSQMTDSEGNNVLDLYSGNQYLVKVEKEGYESQMVLVTPEELDKGLDVQLKKSVACVPFVANIFDNAASGQRLPIAQFIITNTETKEQQILYSDANGKVEYCLKCEGRYSAKAVANGLESAMELFSTKGCDVNNKIESTFYVNGASRNPLVEGTKIQLPHIYFNFNDAGLRPDAGKDLDALAVLMELYPSIEIELASHTDARGTTRYNLALSQKRSDNAKNYLLNKRIESERVLAIGYGEKFIRNRCVDGVRCSESEHQMNRRTEVIISKIDAEAKAELAAINPVTPEENTAVAVNYVVNQISYYVIAGTFKNPTYAATQEQLVSSLGYNTEVKYFDAEYQAICVGMFDNEAEAASLANEISSNHKIETYVREVLNIKEDELK